MSESYQTPRMDDEDPLNGPEKPFYDWELDPDFPNGVSAEGLAQIIEMRKVRPADVWPRPESPDEGQFVA